MNVQLAARVDDLRFPWESSIPVFRVHLVTEETEDAGTPVQASNPEQAAYILTGEQLVRRIGRNNGSPYGRDGMVEAHRMMAELRSGVQRTGTARLKVRLRSQEAVLYVLDEAAND